MPFKSEKQRRYLWATHPEIAKEWAHKYPRSNKDLPMYANDSDNKKRKKAAAFDLQALLAGYESKRTNLNTSILSENPAENGKQADSKQEKIEIPQNSGPVYAGQEREEGKIEGTIFDGPINNDCRPENAINSLLQKISVVLSPAMAQELERRKAMAEGRPATPQPKNVNLKNYPVASNVTPPPMGMTAPPAAPQSAQQPAQPQQQAQTGMNSPSAHPIQAFGPLSMSGNINGNAAFGAKNSPDSMKTALHAIEKWAFVSGFMDDAIRNAEPLLGGAIGGTLGAGVGGLAGGVYGATSQQKKDQPQPQSRLARILKGILSGAAIGGIGGAGVGAVGLPLLSKKSATRDDHEKQASGNPILAYLSSMDFPVCPDPSDFEILDDDDGGLSKASAQNTPCSCGCGDTVATCKCGPDCKCRKPGGSCYKAEKKAGTPAWQREAGKNDEGGLNAKGRASYNRATGGNLKAPVTEKNPKGKRAKRQNSFCARMCGMKKHETGSKTKKDPDSRINKSLRKWNCKCSSAMAFGVKMATGVLPAATKAVEEFDPALSREAENAIIHGTGLVGSTALGTVAGLPLSYGLSAVAERNNWVPDSSKNPYGHAFVNSLLNVPMLAGGALGMRLYDNYILRPHMRRETARKLREQQQQQETAQHNMLAKSAAGDPSLQRVLGTALASTGGGLLLGAYPGWRLQRASEQAGNSEFTNFVAGKAPIALAGALSAGLYNHWLDHQEQPRRKKKPVAEEPQSGVLGYAKYLVH